MPEDKALTTKILNTFTAEFAKLVLRPSFYDHAIDFGFIHTSNIICNFASYSLLCNEWLFKPVRRNFLYAPQELYDAYKQCRNSLKSFEAELPHTGKLLTPESAKVLQRQLQDLKRKAFECKKSAPQHEYEKDYNVYRLLKRFGVWQNFQKHIALSLSGEENPES